MTMDILNYKQQLLEGKRYEHDNLNAKTVPKQKGIYAWLKKDGDEIVYIGSATGKEAGLYRRIIRQHLNPIYLEPRKHIHKESEDFFQLQNPVYTKKGEVAIDKSVLRKKVARAMQLQSGHESVNYLKRTFNVSFIILDDLTDAEILKLEKELINELEPKYNHRGIKKENLY
jgi:hypothetical protein